MRSLYPLSYLPVAASLAVAGVAFGAPPLPPGTLPVPAGNWSSNAADKLLRSPNGLTIQQTAPQGIYNWQTFNIAPGARVDFRQPSTAAAALNRIADANPSLIQGSLSANGKVYLINTNGIVFGDGAQVNVGSLVASSLNLTDEAFLKGILNVSPAFQGASGSVRVEAGANITSASGGQVLLLAPTVENRGRISTPDGQTVLAAGQHLYLTASSDPSVRGIRVQLDGGGSAANLGNILAQRGNVTIAGLLVNQSGKVSASTSVAANGSIYLLAAERPILDVNGNVAAPARPGKVTFGAGSATAVLPELASNQTSTDQQTFRPSQVIVNAQSVIAQSGAKIQVPGGNVTVTASDPNGNTNGRIYLAAGATIDVSGTRDVPISMARNFIDVQLNGNELRDASLQKDGFLKGRTVTVDSRVGTPLADISGAVAQTGRTVAERTAVGGTVALVSDGDVVLRTGSKIDVSGGTLSYASGLGSSSSLIDVNGHVVDIGQARPDQVYVGIANRYTVTSRTWGVTQTWTALPAFNPGYVEGKNAGSISIQAPAAALDGQLIGQATRGIYQRTPGTLPQGGLLVLGNPGTGVVPPDFIAPDIVLANAVTALSAGFTPATALPADRISAISMAAERLVGNGMMRLDFGSNGAIRMEPGVDLDLGAQGRLALHATRIDIRGSVRAAGGSVLLEELDTVSGSGRGITLGPGARISVAGRWVNDLPPLLDLGKAQAIDAGSVTMTSSTGVALAPGSAVDVSAGASYTSAGLLRLGAPGSINIVTNRGLLFGEKATGELVLGGALTGYGFDRGGSLTLTAGLVNVGGATGAAGELARGGGFFTRGGFQHISVTGIDGVSISGAIAPVLQSYSLSPLATVHESADDLSRLVDVTVLPANQRQAVTLAFAATDSVLGDVVVARGATVATEPGGSIALTASHQMTIEGAIAAPGGRISLLMSGNPTNKDSDDGFHPGQSIWLGQNASLSTAGTAVSYRDACGNRIGTVYPGGEVEITANKGYIVTAPQSLIDVSGAAATLDLPASFGSGAASSAREVVSDAGAIKLQSREGVLLGGALLARTFAPSAQGGQLSLALDVAGVDPVGRSYPTSPRRVALRPEALAFPVGLAPGAPLDVAQFNGHAVLAPAQVSGFDSIALKAADEVRVEGTVKLGVRRSITLDAPSIGGTAGSSLSIDSAYIALGNSDPRYQVAREPSAGDAVLSAHAATIDLIGRFATAGIGSTQLTADGDIRLQGVLPVDTSVTALTGAMTTEGGVVLTAAQTYPTTLSQYTIAAQGPSGSVHVTGGRSSSPPLSAGGSLTIAARRIDIEGTVRAPFGSIALQAGDCLTLASGSLVSVSGRGLTVPFGVTLNQTRWAYDLGNGNSATINAPPEKAVLLSGAQVSVASGARVDLSGGGNLHAWEFVPGNGGSADVLAAPGTYAIVPSLSRAYAPRDWQNDAGSALQAGDAVYLSGVGGLAPGVYTLLPAHYALQPAGFSVSSISGTTDMLSAGNYVRFDGSYVVAGYRTVLGLSVAESRNSGFLVTPAGAIGRQSQFIDTDADRFFATQSRAAGTPIPPLERDAGRLVVQATAGLALGGAFDFSAREGLGGRADISAPQIEIVGTPGPSDGSVQIAADALSKLGAQSLLLGGTRTGTSQVTIDVGASSVTVRNDASHVLRAREVILVANDWVELAANSTVKSLVAPSGGAGSLVAPRSGAQALVAPGGAALVRVAVSAPVSVIRSGAGATTGTGTVRMDANAQLTADGAIQLEAAGDTLIDHTARIAAPAITVSSSSVALGSAPLGRSGLVIDEALLAQLGKATLLTLRSYGAIDFFGDVTLGTPARPLNGLTIDAAALTGFGDGAVTVQAKTITLANSSGSEAPAVGSGNGTLHLTATGGDILLGSGAMAISGFATTRLDARRDIRASGTGRLSAAGDLALAAARITADSASEQTIGATGGIAILANPQSAAPVPGAGLAATLSMTAARIQQAGRIELLGGTLTLAANGPGDGDGIDLAAGSSISVAGVGKVFRGAVAYAPGGTLSLNTSRGSVTLAQGARVDFSGAAGGGDAGSLSISAINGTFASHGTLLGGAASGSASGSFKLDAGRIEGFSALNAALEAGAVAGSRSLRARTGNIKVGASDALHANSIELVADAGGIDLAGSVTAAGSRAGTIAAWADGALTVSSGARLVAQGVPAHAGLIELGTQTGRVALQAGSSIDVSGSAGSAADGTVWLRAPQDGSDVAVDMLPSAVVGARTIVIEAFRPYSGVGRIDVAGGPGVLTQAQVQADVAQFMSTSNVILARLQVADDARIHVVPGVEVRSSSALTVAADWNLAQPGSASGSGGALTLRASGNLVLNGSISDGFANAASTAPLQSGSSWSLRLAGGSDLTAANPLAVIPGNGAVTLAAGKLVRTGTGSIDVAAGGDVSFASGASAIYTAGSKVTTVGGFAPPTGADFASGGGNVSITASGSIVTVDSPSSQAVNDWLFRQGSLPANVSPGSGSAGVAYAVHPAWGVSSSNFRQNVGALGGGDVTLTAGGSIVSVSAAVPTNGTVSGNTPATSQPIIFGGGDLRISAGKDVAGGLYYVAQGRGTIRAGGLLRPAATQPGPVLALGDATFDIASARGITLGGAFAPTLAPQGRNNVTNAVNDGRLSYFSQFGSSSGVHLLALTGDLTLADGTSAIVQAYGGGLRLPAGLGYLPNFALYPGTLDAVALQGNVTVAGDKSLSLYAQPGGNLRLLAAGDIRLNRTVYMADVDPAIQPQVTAPARSLPPAPASVTWTGAAGHAATPLHAADTDIAEIVALAGSVIGTVDFPTVYLAKPVLISAGQDVRDIWIYGQNTKASDVSAIEAGRDIFFSTPPSAQGQLVTTGAGVYWGGPGTLELMAGRNVDLGSGAGVISRGNLDNPGVPAAGASILAVAGLGRDLDQALRQPATRTFVAAYLGPDSPSAAEYREQLADYMAGLGQPGLEGAALLSAFYALPVERQLPFATSVLFTELAAAGAATTRAGFQPGYDAIERLFPGANPSADVRVQRPHYSGDVRMYLSQIKTERGGDITFLVPGGLVNEGLAVPPAGLSKTASQLGIVTVQGGSVRAFTQSNFQVSQSRVFTLRGGDIFIWSSYGNIDAGKGAKTVAYAPEPTIITKSDGSVEFDYNAAASGSGIGVLLTDPTIAPGRVDLIAPNGFVDAGEAGIRSAGDVHIAALQVLNVGYIQAGGSVTGLPPALDVAALSSGLISAGSATSGVSRAVDAAAQSMAAPAPSSGSLSPLFPLNYLTVEVLGFGQECRREDGKCGAQAP